MGASFYSPGPLLALELQNWNGRGTTGKKQALTDPDLFDGTMRVNVTGCPAYLLKRRIISLAQERIEGAERRSTARQIRR